MTMSRDPVYRSPNKDDNSSPIMSANNEHAELLREITGYLDSGWTGEKGVRLDFSIS